MAAASTSADAAPRKLSPEDRARLDAQLATEAYTRGCDRAMCVVEPEICWWRGTADVGLRERMTRSMGLGLGLADRRPGLAGTWHYSALLMVGTGTGHWSPHV